MNSRDRVNMALNHQEPDRIPLDLGATVLTGIHIDAYQKLREYLGLSLRDAPPVLDMKQQLAVVEDDVRDFFKVDARNVASRSSESVEIEIKDMGDSTFFYDEWGIGWRKPKQSGLYYDMFDHPLDKVTSQDDIKPYPWPDPVDAVRFEGLGQKAFHTAEQEKQAVVLGGLCAGVMEIAAWLRGFNNYFMDFAANPDLLGFLMDKVVDLKIAYWEKALAEAGEYVDVVQEADDFAGQFRMLISPETYRRVAKPRHRKLFDFIHAHTNARIFFHSCGSIRPVIPDLIEIGVDILNPVQVSATDMDSADLKKEFGNNITFWGGGVDTQNVLGNGTPDQVRDDVRRRIENLAPGGGFVFATVHNIQPNVPPENIMAMFETLQEYGAYSG